MTSKSPMRVLARTFPPKIAVTQSSKHGLPLLVPSADANGYGADAKQRLAGGVREQQGDFASQGHRHVERLGIGRHELNQRVRSERNFVRLHFVLPLRAVKDTTLWSASGDPRCKRHDASSCFRRIDEGFGPTEADLAPVGDVSR